MNLLLFPDTFVVHSGAVMQGHLPACAQRGHAGLIVAPVCAGHHDDAPRGLRGPFRLDCASRCDVHAGPPPKGGAWLMRFVRAMMRCCGWGGDAALAPNESPRGQHGAEERVGRAPEAFSAGHLSPEKPPGSLRRAIFAFLCTVPRTRLLLAGSEPCFAAVVVPPRLAYRALPWRAAAFGRVTAWVAPLGAGLLPDGGLREEET